MGGTVDVGVGMARGAVARGGKGAGKGAAGGGLVGGIVGPSMASTRQRRLMHVTQRPSGGAYGGGAIPGTACDSGGVFFGRPPGERVWIREPGNP